MNLVPRQPQASKLQLRWSLLSSRFYLHGQLYHDSATQFLIKVGGPEVITSAINTNSIVYSQRKEEEEEENNALYNKI
jgi:hypothetical protein